MTFEGFNGPKSSKSHGNNSSLYAECMSTSHCMTFRWSRTLWVTWGWTSSCITIMLSVSLPRRLFLILARSFLKASDGNSLCWLSLLGLKSRSMGLLMPLWSCLDGFTIWCTICKMCCTVVSISYSPSQLHCSVLVSARVLTEPNPQQRHLHCHRNATNGVWVLQACVLAKWSETKWWADAWYDVSPAELGIQWCLTIQH